MLRYVYLEDGTFVNGELVRLGLATARAYPPDTRHQQLLNELQAAAQAGGRGLWAAPLPTATSAAPGVLVEVRVDPSCSQFNSPGNDNETKAEEYVCLTNPGAEAVDLSGWTIQDEAGWSYRFPAFTLRPGASVRVRTGCGTSTEQDLYWCKDGTAVWNNSGDCAFLRNAQGVEVAQYCY